MPQSAWIQHVKRVSRERNIPYGEAMKVAKSTYKKKPATTKTRKRRRKVPQHGKGIFKDIGKFMKKNKKKIAGGIGAGALAAAYGFASNRRNRTGGAINALAPGFGSLGY